LAGASQGSGVMAVSAADARDRERAPR